MFMSIPQLPAHGCPQEWCFEAAAYLKANHSNLTLFPRYYEVRAIGFVVLQSLFPEYFKRHNRVVEIGCGVGLDSLYWSRYADEMLGFDIPGEYGGYTPPGFTSSAHVSRTLVCDIFGATNAKFEDALPDSLPVDSDSADVVYSWTVLEHVPDLPSAYKEMHRILKPGGVMLHIVPNVMSAVDTVVRENIRKPTPLGWFGAARHMWKEFSTLAKQGHKPGALIPPCHSEFLTDYMDQLNLYISDSYIAPALELGFRLERLSLVRDYNHLIALRKA
jgi:SAM-dependent methyltransferase